MKEADLESIFAKYPDLVEEGLILLGRQITIYGRRMDLLFEDRFKRKLIIELKSGPIKDEHIGQILSYEGMMLSADNPDIRIMLIGTRVPPNIQKSLDHHGIAWKEVKLSYLRDALVHRGDGQFHYLFDDEADFLKSNNNQNTRTKTKSLDNLHSGMIEGFSKEDFHSVVTQNKVANVARLNDDLLPLVERQYPNFEITVYRILHAHSFDVDVAYDNYSRSTVITYPALGAAWFAFSFGKTVNDVPNISAIMSPSAFDVCVNAEIQPSQKVMLTKIAKSSTEFDRILSHIGGITLKTYLKIQHRPYSYHWVSIDCLNPGEFNADFIIKNYHKHKQAFPEERKRWVEFITSENKGLTPKQVAYIEEFNKSINFCNRLVLPISSDDSIWDKGYNAQFDAFAERIAKLKELVIFFNG